MMRVLDPGHRYALDNLETGGETIIQFYKDPSLHAGDGYSGPSCQEYLRAIIDRVQELDRERPHVLNAGIIYDLRHAIAGFEGRAIIRRVEKEGLPIEQVPERDFFIWWGCKKLTTDRDARKAKYAEYMKRREAAKAGWQRRRAM